MQIFGDKTVALFDLWSIEHFISGMAMIVTIRMFSLRFWPDIYRSTDINKRACDTSMLVSLLAIALFWESCEFYMEAGYTRVARVTDWFQGVEFWGNRLITDPLLTLAGGYVGLQSNRACIFARFFSLIWLAVHVFFLPNSMYLQHLLVEVFN